MIYLPTGAQMRAADMYTIHEIGIPSLVLMERAALESVRCMEEQQVDFRNVLVLCGSGNNGGDGYVIARLLKQKGYSVTILFAGNPEKRSEENQVQANIAAHYDIPVITNLGTDEYTVIIDALFGTGLAREIGGSYYELIRKVNELSGTKVAIDIPSGIHDTTGNVMGIALKADFTVALAFTKRGLVLNDGNTYAGKIFTREIGISDETLCSDDVTYAYSMDDFRALMPRRKRNSNKGTYGRILMITGSRGMSGAAYLAAKAAYAVGGGLVQIYTHESNRVILQQLLPEAIITTYEEYDEEQLEQLLAWADVVSIGSGLGISACSERLTEHVLKRTVCPCVIDADGLNLLSKHPEWYAYANENWILTPHMKEMSRLLGCEMKELLEHQEERLCSFTEEHPVVCVMKNARTFVMQRGKKRYLNLSGNAAMAKAGSGDVLAGIVTGLVAQKMDGYQAATVGVYLHGLSGDLMRRQKGEYSVMASDLIDGISGVLKDL